MSPQTQRESVLRWAATNAMSDGAVVTSVEALRPGAPPWLLEIAGRERMVRAVLKAGNGDEIATEAAALRLAQEHGIPAPNLLAVDVVGDYAGAPALLMSLVEGTDQVPRKATAARLRSLGAAAAAIHAVPFQPSPELPARERHIPWIDLSAERRTGAAETTPLLSEADDALVAVAPPVGESVFVHGDLWAGNTLWCGDTVTATIDWEAAGCGSYGVDLGALRLDAALLHSPDAADEILAGWQQARGRAAHDVAYWDVVAAANTPPDMTPFTTTMHQAGRDDLDGAVLSARRDAFLRTALDRLT